MPAEGADDRRGRGAGKGCSERFNASWNVNHGIYKLENMDNYMGIQWGLMDNYTITIKID